MLYLAVILGCSVAAFGIAYARRGDTRYDYVSVWDEQMETFVEHVREI